MSSISDYVKYAFSDSSIGLALRALLIDVAIVIFVALLLSSKISLYPHVDLAIDLPPFERSVLAFAFIIIFPVVWYIFHLQNQKAAIDVYSGTREKMTGKWLVRYDRVIADDGRVVVPERVSECCIRKNFKEKLELTFYIIGNNPIFESQAPLIVRDVAIRDNENGGFTVFYYYENKRKLSQNIRELLNEQDPYRLSIEIEVFGIVTFPDPGSKPQVPQMDGKWYDLNGNMMRIFTLMDLHDTMVIRREPWKTIGFHQIPIEDKHFDSDMGAVTFSFHGALDS